MTVSPVPSNMKTYSKIYGEKVILSNSFQLMQGYYINYNFFCKQAHHPFFIPEELYKQRHY